MKSYAHLFHRFIILTAFTLFWSCLEYDITTKVESNGRMLRTIIVKGDSAAIFAGSFPVPSDPSWIITTQREQRADSDIDEARLYVYEARKEFSDFRALNQDFYNDTSFGDHISIRVNLVKKIRGFYKYFLYTETYRKIFPFNSRPVSRYLNDTELRILMSDDKETYYIPEKDSIGFVIDSSNLPVLTSDDSLRYKELQDSIENKFQTWQKFNVYDNFFTLVTHSLLRCGREIDTVNTREPFYRWLDSANTMKTGLENSDAFLDAAAVYFKIDTSQLRAANVEGFKNFKQKIRISASYWEKYTIRVVMPGRIVHSNATKVNKDMASWIFKTENFYAADYSMLVESRMINKWVLAILLVIVGILAALAVKKYKK